MGFGFVWLESEGGGILTLVDLTLSHCAFRENTAPYGGAVAAPYSNLTVIDCDFSRNSAVRRGGAIKVSQIYPNYPFYLYALTIIDSTFSENVAGAGGAVNSGCHTLEITGSIFEGNSAGSGGAIAFTAVEATLVNTVFTGNHASYGGAIKISAASEFDLRETDTASITNCTIAGNTGYWAAGLYFSYTLANLTLTNTIVADNRTTADQWQDIGFSTWDPGEASVHASHNLIGDGRNQTIIVHGANGNLVGTGESPIDPGFVRNPSDGGDGWADDPETPDVDETANNDYGDLRLSVDSIAVNAGDNASLPADDFDLDVDGDTEEPLPVDFAGGPRIAGQCVDIGAYEYTSVSPADHRLYVDVDAVGANDGASWADALTDLQNALNHATILNTDGSTNNDVDEIWIAEGTYRPSAELEPGDPRSASFSLVDGVALYGGFAGTEAVLSERRVSAYITTLSGDLGVLNDIEDNAYTVVYCGEEVTARLDGVTVAEGNADAETIGDHLERVYGGGVFNEGELIVFQSTFARNRASRGGAACSCGITTILDSSFSYNVAKTDGGAVYHWSDNLLISNTSFSHNSTTTTSYPGGGGGNLQPRIRRNANGDLLDFQT